MKYYIVCTQPRSGTHFLRKIFLQNQMGNPIEAIYHMNRDNIQDIESFLALGKTRKPQNAWGMSVH